MTIDLNKKGLKVLITGGAGFIGGCLVRRFLDFHENVTIFNLDKLSYASDLEGINKFKNNEQYFLIKVDLNNSLDIRKAIKEIDPDIIFHLAAESHVDRSIDNPKIFVESNIIGTFNLLEATREHWTNLQDSRKNEFRFLHISTDEVFGSLGEIGSFNEKTAYDPRSPYSASKAASDHLTNAWFHTYKLPIIKTNCSNNFGPYQFPEKFIPIIINKALNNSTIPIYGDGQNIRDWLYVEDHIDALILIAQEAEIGSSFCIGGNNEKSNFEVVNIICEFLDRKISRESKYSDLISFVKDRPGHDKRYSINSELLSKTLGWEPSHSFEEGINKTIEWYLANQKWCANILSNSGYSGERIGLENNKRN